ncbi:MAG: cache domain-containing protein [Lachnospiraceae bacterium]|nr:cache domain-containing protein [Lachnospiraceae bacterium]
MEKLKSVLLLLLPYISIVFLLIMSIGYLGTLLVESYRERILENQQKSIETAVQRFGERMKGVEDISYLLEDSKAVKKYAYASLSNQKNALLEYIDVMVELNNYQYSQDIAEIYLFDSKNERVITSSAAFSNAEEYFKYNYQIEGMSVKDSVERLKTPAYGCEYSAVMDVKLKGEQFEVIEYRLRVPIEWGGDNNLKLVIVMKTADIFGDLAHALDEGGEFYVYDKNERLIYCSGTKWNEPFAQSGGPELKSVYCDGENIYASSLQTADERWSVRICLPDFVDRSHISIPHLGMLVIVPILVSIILCVYFTYKNHKKISEALSENIRFKGRIESYEKGRKHQILDKMIRGAYGSSEEMKKALSEIAFHNTDISCAALCIRYEGSDYRKAVSEELTIKDMVRNLLTESSECETEIFDTTARETVCILFNDANEDMELAVRNMISGLNVEIFYYYGIEAQLGVGNPVSSIYEISSSYTQAKTVISYRETLGNNVLFFSELTQLEDVCWYPKEFDEMIFNYIIAGKAQEAKELVGKLYRENLENGSRMVPIKAISMMKSTGRLSVFCGGKIQHLCRGIFRNSARLSEYRKLF